MEYTKMQMQYIESVDGAAHQSAVEIIGALENALRNTIAVHVISDYEWDANKALEKKMKDLGF